MTIWLTMLYVWHDIFIPRIWLDLLIAPDARCPVDLFASNVNSGPWNASGTKFSPSRDPSYFENGRQPQDVAWRDVPILST